MSLIILLNIEILPTNFTMIQNYLVHMKVHMSPKVLHMFYSYQFWVNVVKYFFHFSKTRLSQRFESYFIKSIYVVTFKPLRQTGFRKNEKVFDYINSEWIREQHIKRMGVLKKLTHPNVHHLHNWGLLLLKKQSFFLC